MARTEGQIAKIGHLTTTLDKLKEKTEMGTKRIRTLLHTHKDRFARQFKEAIDQGWAEWAKQPAELHTLHWADQETGRRKVRASTKLNEESIATVGDDLTADYQAFVDHHPEEIVQPLEEFGVAQVEMTRHLQ